MVECDPSKEGLKAKIEWLEEQVREYVALAEGLQEEMKRMRRVLDFYERTVFKGAAPKEEDGAKD